LIGKAAMNSDEALGFGKRSQDTLAQEPAPSVGLDRTERTTTKPAAERFLDGLRACGSIRQACRQTGVTRSTVYEWRNADPEFRARWDEALEQGLDALEDEGMRRAFAGSDRLLMYMLSNRRKSVYGNRAAEARSSPGGKGIPFDFNAGRRLPRDDLAEIKAAEKLAAITKGTTDA
jgi:hypothetical protein